MPVIDGLPVPEPLRQITPRAPGPGPEEDPVDHLPVIGPPATARRISGQEPPQAIPLLISQIMAIQQIKRAIVNTCGSRSFRLLRAGSPRRAVQQVCPW